MADDFTIALADVCAGHEALRPPNRVSVSQGIAQTLYIKRPGGAAGYWNPHETEYMVEPADMLGSRRHGAVCFVGPAQSGKTVALVDGWLSHAIANDPGDPVLSRSLVTLHHPIHGQPFLLDLAALSLVLAA